MTALTPSGTRVRLRSGDTRIASVGRRPHPMVDGFALVADRGCGGEQGLRSLRHQFPRTM
jgi:hypothetical protein